MRKRKTKTRWLMGFALLPALAGGAALTGCNTVQGAGTDIKKGGEAIANTADKAKGGSGSSGTHTTRSSTTTTSTSTTR